jgi:putative Holliday junction resolvase
MDLSARASRLQARFSIFLTRRALKLLEDHQRHENDPRCNVIGRWIGVDYGTRRIGVAIGDAETGIASPAAAIPGSGSTERDAERVALFAVAHSATGAVIGLPLNMDGSVGPQADLTKRFAAALEKAGSLRLELWDERLTTFQANEWLRESGLTRAKRKRKRDAIAAQIILQSFLDRARTGRPPNETPQG